MLGNASAITMAVMCTVWLVVRWALSPPDVPTLLEGGFIWFVTIIGPYVSYRRLTIRYSPVEESDKAALFLSLTFGYAMFFYVFWWLDRTRSA